MRPAPGPARYAVRALAPDLQARFDALACASRERAAKRLGTTAIVIDRLAYGGKARAETVERVETALRQLEGATS